MKKSHTMYALCFYVRSSCNPKLNPKIRRIRRRTFARQKSAKNVSLVDAATGFCPQKKSAEKY